MLAVRIVTTRTSNMYLCLRITSVSRNHVCTGECLHMARCVYAFHESPAALSTNIYDTYDRMRIWHRLNTRMNLSIVVVLAYCIGQGHTQGEKQSKKPEHVTCLLARARIGANQSFNHRCSFQRPHHPPRGIINVGVMALAAGSTR